MGCLSYLLGPFLLFLLTCYAVATSTSVWRRLAKTTCRYTVDRYPFTRPSFYIVFCVCRIVSYYAHSKTCKQSLAPREMASSHRYLISEPTLITSLPFINNIKEAFESLAVGFSYVSLISVHWTDCFFFRCLAQRRLRRLASLRVWWNLPWPLITRWAYIITGRVY